MKIGLLKIINILSTVNKEVINKEVMNDTRTLYNLNLQLC